MLASQRHGLQLDDMVNVVNTEQQINPFAVNGKRTQRPS